MAKAKHHKLIIRKRRVQIFVAVAVAIVLLILVVGFIFYYHPISNKLSNFLVENKFYGFKLQTPKGWIGEEKTIYSEENIGKLLEKCKNDMEDNEVGLFRFKSQRYPQGFGTPEFLTAGFPSGLILEMGIECVNKEARKGILDAPPAEGSVDVAEETARINNIGSPNFGKTKLL